VEQVTTWVFAGVNRWIGYLQSCFSASRSFSLSLQRAGVRSGGRGGITRQRGREPRAVGELAEVDGVLRLVYPLLPSLSDHRLLHDSTFKDFG
jgi:hypothetical protein